MTLNQKSESILEETQRDLSTFETHSSHIKLSIYYYQEVCITYTVP